MVTAVKRFREGESIKMPEETQIYHPEDHPWVEMPTESSGDDEIRYSLDEIRIE